MPAERVACWRTSAERPALGVGPLSNARTPSALRWASIPEKRHVRTSRGAALGGGRAAWH
eukprot:13343286-Alexandrium_andersonii.AAC.1